MVVAVAMAFDIGLIDHVQAVLARQFVPAFLVRVVRVTNRVHVRRFHELDVLQHRFFVNNVPCFFMMFMQVHALEFDEFAVDHETAILDLDRAKTDFLSNRFSSGRNRHRVLIRFLG